MQKHFKFTFTLDREDARRFKAMSDRLRLGSHEEAAYYLIMAAIEALEGEEHFIWPLYLIQASSNAL